MKNKEKYAIKIVSFGVLAMVLSRIIWIAI